MTEKDKEDLIKNCYNDLNIFNDFLDSLLEDDTLKKDDEIINTKKNVIESIERIESLIDNGDDKIPVRKK